MQWSTWGSAHISDSGRDSEIKISQQSSGSDGHQGQQTTSRGSMSVCIKAGATWQQGKKSNNQPAAMATRSASAPSMTATANSNNALQWQQRLQSEIKIFESMTNWQ